MWGSLGGLGDLYGVLHGCVGHWGGGWRSLRSVTWVWGPLGGVGDWYRVLHGCGGH